MRKTRNERKRDRLYRLAFILAVFVWLLVVIYVLSIPAKSEKPAVKHPTLEDLRREWMLETADLNKPAAEPVIVTYPYYDVPLSEALQEDLRCACNEFDVDMPLRMHSGDVQELFRIKCMTCGHKTNWYKTLSYASRAWNKESGDV